MSLHFPFKKSLEISGYGKTAFMSIIERGFKGSNESFYIYKNTFKVW